MRHRNILLALIGSVGLAACGEPTQLYIAHNTVVGLDAAVDTNRQSGRLLFGYDRQFIALAPKAVPHRTDPEHPDPICDRPGDGANGGEGQTARADCREAMAALSCNEVEVRGIFLTRFKDNLATGTAATEAAKTIKKAADNLATGKGSEQEHRAIPAFFDCWEVKSIIAKPEEQ